MAHVNRTSCNINIPPQTFFTRLLLSIKIKHSAPSLAVKNLRFLFSRDSTWPPRDKGNGGLTSGGRGRIYKTISVLYSLLYGRALFSLFIVLSFCGYCFAISMSSSRSKSH